MENTRNIENTIDYLRSKRPEELARFAKKVSKEYPETIHHLMAHVAKGDHITNHNEYYECVEDLKWCNNEGKGEKFQLDDIVRMAKKLIHVDFEEEEFTEYDFAYMVNLLYAIFCKDFKEPTTFLRLAKRIFDYSEIGKEEHYGAFFKPIKKHKQHSEYRSQYENRRGYPRNDYEEDRYEENRRNDYDNRQYNDSEYRRRYR